MVVTRSSTKRAEMTDQHAATSAATGEPSQQPAMAANISEFMDELLARDTRERADRVKTGQNKTHDGRRFWRSGRQNSRRRGLSTRRCFVRKRRRGRMPLRYVRNGLSAARQHKLYPASRLIPVLIPVIGLVRRPAGQPAGSPAGSPARWPAGIPARQPAGSPARWPAGRPTGRPAGRRPMKRQAGRTGRKTGEAAGETPDGMGRRQVRRRARRTAGRTAGRPARRQLRRPTRRPAARLFDCAEMHIYV